MVVYGKSDCGLCPATNGGAVLKNRVLKYMVDLHECACAVPYMGHIESRANFPASLLKYSVVVLQRLSCLIAALRLRPCMLSSECH